MATIMTANVFFIIMPNQRKSVAALMAGQKPDPHGARARRSVQLTTTTSRSRWFS